MKNFITSQLVKFKNDERGASAIEYAVMAAILVAVIVFAVSLIGTPSDSTVGMGKAFNDIKTELE